MGITIELFFQYTWIFRLDVRDLFMTGQHYQAASQQVTQARISSLRKILQESAEVDPSTSARSSLLPSLALLGSKAANAGAGRRQSPAPISSNIATSKYDVGGGMDSCGRV